MVVFGLRLRPLPHGAFEVAAFARVLRDAGREGGGGPAGAPAREARGRDGGGLGGGGVDFEGGDGGELRR